MMQIQNAFTAPLAPAVVHYPLNHPGRGQVEGFIQKVYDAKFQAQLSHFAPMLVGLHDHDGELVAAAGYRPAEEGPLFLERYLSAPVEQLLLGPDADPQKRRGIVEVGHLAAVRAGEGRHLIVALAQTLAQAGFDWVVSTMTLELRHLFVRMGIAPLALGQADPDKLGSAASTWGRYYDHAPVVLAGQLAQAHRRLSSIGLMEVGA